MNSSMTIEQARARRKIFGKDSGPVHAMSDTSKFAGLATSESEHYTKVTCVVVETCTIAEGMTGTSASRHNREKPIIRNL